MSQPSVTESLKDAAQGFDSSVDRIRDLYHVPVLLALMAFMLWVRVRNWENFIVDGRVLFSGNDAWYHYRMVQYTVAHFPGTMPFDPWTGFPEGTAVGQFGTLFDQIIALGALIVGLGSPTDHQIALTHLFAPAVFGAATVIPVYFIGKRLGGRAGGLVAALLLALTPGQFLTRSLAGFADHQVGEALFMAMAVAALLVALDVAVREKPVLELLTGGDYDALYPSVKYAAIAGLFLGLYMWVWPPGVFLVGILGIYFGVTLPLQYVRGESPDHLAAAGVVVGLVTVVMTLIPINTFELTATDFSLVQPTLAFLLAVECAVLAGLARLWDDRELDPRGLPLAVGALVVVGALVFAVGLPDLFAYFQRQFLRIFGLGATATSLTVGEAQPPENAATFLYGSYGLALFTGLAGVLYMLYRVFQRRDLAPVSLFVSMWFVFLVLATLTQQRFDYYLVLAVGAANAVLVPALISVLDLDVMESVADVKAYQVLSVLAAILVLTGPLVYGANAVQISNQRSQPGEVANWDSSLEWTSENTPVEGAYGTGGDGTLEYFGTFERTGNYDYENGEYGVMAWWDYGHWITVLGERIPVANPFQQNARLAANYLLADNASNADEFMVSPEGEQTRYVMIDYQMGLAGTRKFSAPAAWETEHDVSRSDLSMPVYAVNQQTGAVQLAYGVKTQRSMESMRTRLYQYHGSAMGPETPNSALGGRVVVANWDDTRFQNGQTLPTIPSEGQPLSVHRNLTAAREYVRQNGSAQVGGVLGEPQEKIPALQHYRLVHASSERAETPVSRGYRFALVQQGQQAQPLEVQPWVKTFERVPGATVEGQGPPNSTVQAAVRMGIPTTNSSFLYVQEADTGPDGSFEMTLPYSTTGYEEYGTEAGYTNVSVRAETSYQFSVGPVTNESLVTSVWSDTANVSEGQVLGEVEDPVEVSLEEQVISRPEGANTTEGNATTGNATVGNATDGNATLTNATGENASGANASGSMSAGTGTGAFGDRAAPTDVRRVASPSGSLAGPAAVQSSGSPTGLTATVRG
jgi:dolichyl-diphosphooligosaccharide--protein glycosyltransferase